MARAVRSTLWLAAARRDVALTVEMPGFATLRKGSKQAPTVSLTGRPGEVMLWLLGRREVADVTVDGPGREFINGSESLF